MLFVFDSLNDPRSKCNKFVIGKKSAVGDKPTVKRHDNTISWDRLPYAVDPIHTTYDAEAQKVTVSSQVLQIGTPLLTRLVR